MTANRVSLNDVENFARARPDQSLIRMLGDDLERLAHDGHWVTTTVGDTSGED